MNNPILSVRDIYFAYPPDRMTSRAGSQNNKEDIFSIKVDRLDIYPGERLALIGPNGAGKTTLLQLIALLQQPNQGTISFNNSVVKTDSQILVYHRSTAFVPQKAILYNCLVKDNVGLGLKIRNVTASEINNKTSDILRTFKIEHLANRSALRISGGEARRVMLARALVLNPKILFLDEPFGDLDEPVRIELMNDLLPVLSRAGCATIFVTHNQDETYQLADRFMIMLKGRIVQSGTGQEIFGNPANQEIAQFIGIKNILSAQVISTDKDIIHVSLITPNKPAPQLYVSGAQPKTENVVICIPPESIIIVADPPDRSPEGEVSPKAEMTSRAGPNQAMHSSPVRVAADRHNKTNQRFKTLTEDDSNGVKMLHCFATASSRNNISGRVKRIIPSRYFVWVEIDCGVTLTASITNESIRELGLTPGKTVQLLIKSTAIRLLGK